MQSTKLKEVRLKGDLISLLMVESINHVGMMPKQLVMKLNLFILLLQAGVIISSTEEPYYKSVFIQISVFRKLIDSFYTDIYHFTSSSM